MLIRWPVAASMVFALAWFVTYNNSKSRMSSPREAQAQGQVQGQGQGLLLLPVPEGTDRDWITKLVPVTAPVPMPVVYRHVVRHWPAVITWSPQFFTDFFANDMRMFEAKCHHHNVFLYHSPNDFIPTPATITTTPSLPLSLPMRLKDFWNIDQKATPNRYYYFTTNLNNLPELASAMPDLNSLRIALEGDGYAANLWMGSANITAYMHYDESHNLFAQIYGRKRFVLLPPECHRYFKLHPHLHSSQRNVQFDGSKIELPDLLLSSMLTASKPPLAYEVSLSPGDVLYLPPFWFHHVIALKDSISVNMWSESKDANVLTLMTRVPLPFEEHWELETMMAAAKAYMCLLSSSVMGEEETNKLFTHLASTRYSPVYGKASCSSFDGSGIMESRSEYREFVAAFRVHKYFLEHKALLTSIAAERRGARELTLLSFVETAVYYSIGVRHCNHFIQCTLTTECLLSFAYLN